MIRRRWCGPGYPRWDADDQGRVYRDGVEVVPYPDKQGYLRVWSGGGDGRPVFVHTLVATAFHGRCPDGLECLHHNDVPDDNTPGNLRWGTTRENVADAMRNGRRRRALTAEESAAKVAEMRAKYGYTVDGVLVPDDCATEEQRAARLAIGLVP